MKRFGFLLLAFLAACSNGGGSFGSPSQPTTTQYPYNTFAVTTDADLPTCSGDIVGRLYYIESTAGFKVCKTSGWTAISVKGNDGITISTVKRCNKISGGLVFEHNIVTYSTNDKFVYCAISNAAATYSATAIYKSTQTGSVSEGCALTYDLDTVTSGFWIFSVSGSTRTAVYSDSGSASNGTTVTFATSDCTSN